jgi:GNAT superfamily N-acetyltransferase
VNTPSIEIRRMQTKADMGRFIKFPWRIYRNDPAWVPPLIGEVKKLLSPRKNPFWEHAEAAYFLAYRGGEPVGRISAIVNHAHNEAHAEEAGFFGFFESVQDEAVSGALYGAALEWLADRGMHVMRGPANPSSNDDWGFLLEGYNEPPTVMMPYNPSYYHDLAKAAGLSKVKDLYSFFMDHTAEIADKAVRVAEIAKRKTGVRIRSIDLKNLDAELRFIKEVYNSAWELNWGFVPMTDREIEHLALDLKKIVVPDLVLMAEVDGKPAGVSITIPNINEILHRMNGRLFPFGWLKFLLGFRRIKRVRVIIMGVVKEYRKRGIDAVFYVDTFNRGKELGFTEGEMGWILEDNDIMNQTIEMFGGRLYRRYRLYEKPI